MLSMMSIFQAKLVEIWPLVHTNLENYRACVLGGRKNGIEAVPFGTDFEKLFFIIKNRKVFLILWKHI